MPNRERGKYSENTLASRDSRDTRVNLNYFNAQRAAAEGDLSAGTTPHEGEHYDFGDTRVNLNYFDVQRAATGQTPQQADTYYSSYTPESSFTAQQAGHQHPFYQQPYVR